ncbi:type 2 lanthipeptide synthetase LanM [Kitasatospora terrestris]|uniref:Lantibiotic biosynthesis protein dehydration domain-containing protein n=1 Tax=Kitasatospora terrestris TaxID=258051 RepID=A0ABP9DFG5_9ACTN
MSLDLQTWLRTTGSPAPTGTAGPVLLPDVPGGDERLRAVVSAAASFEERAAARADGEALFEPDPGEDRRSRAAAVETWLSRAAGEQRAAGVLLDHLAETGRPLGEGLRRVRLADPARLPAWAHALAVFLRAQPTDRAPGPGALVEGFVRAAAALLPSAAGGILGVPVTEEARADLAKTLTGRLTEACNLSFCHEFQLSTGRPRATGWDAEGGLDSSQDGWLARLERLPGLAFLVGTVCLQWQHVYTEMFARLAADRHLLVGRMWQGTDPGALHSVRGDAGDRHAGGRSVALLRFADGQGVVYKPKDMRHATAFLALAARLNKELSLDLPLRTVLVRSDRGDDGHGASLDTGCESDYGWEELVPSRPCADRSGFARFYTRLGMTIRLVQLLEGRDLWADNLLADGEHPVLIDLECLLYPRVQAPPVLSAAQHGLLDELETTVVRTAMAFQAWTPAGRTDALDIGCLSRVGGLEVAPGVPALPLPPYRPVADGEPADPWEYTEQVVEGYREMHRTLYRLREELADPEGPLSGFRGVWVRYIWRHTWDGYKILRASTSPLALDDGATRETVIAGALRGAVVARAGDPDRGDLLEVVLSELDSFRIFDIPFFRSLTTSSSVFTADGREIPGHFQSTGWKRLQQRVAELEGFDLEAHVGVLSGCVDAARLGTELSRPAPSPVRRRAVPGPGELLERAAAIGDRILTDRRRTGWLGQSWYPGTGLRQVEVLGPDLVSGTLGIALLFAELWSATGEPRFHRASHRLLTEAASLVDPDEPRAFSFAGDSRLASGAPVPGGFAGPGALIHGLARGGLLLGEPGFLSAAQALVPGALTVARSASDRPGRPAKVPHADLPLGTAGLLLNLLRLRRASGAGHAPTDEAIRTLAATAVADLGDPDARIPEFDFLDLVPGGADSVAAALARTLAEAPALLADPAAARERLAAHRFATGTRSGRLACLDTAVSLGADAVDQADLGSLTPPVTGPALASLTGRALVATAGEALTAAEAGLLHTVPEGTTALVPGPFFDGREAAGLLVRELMERRQAYGTWFPDRAAEDSVNLGALDGTVAIGLLLLRLYDPAAAPLATLR